VKLINYMPQYLKNIREFQEIFKSEDEQLEYMNILIAKMLTEVIVKTADSYGLTRYEKIYNITEVAPTIESRRANILLKMNNRTPFTMNWLNNKLRQLVGEGNYSIKLEHDKYKLTIKLAYTNNDLIYLLEKELREQIPANMELNIYADGAVDISNDISLVGCVTNYEIISVGSNL
jgi:hypothetical protein